MAAQTNLLEPRYWSTSDWEALGIKIDPAFVINAGLNFWEDKRNDRTQSKKAYLPIDKGALLCDDRYAHLEKKYRDKPLDLRVGTLTATIGSVSGAKFLSSNPVNLDLGKPRQSSVIALKDLFSGDFLGVLDGTEISNARTALYAVKTWDICFSHKRDVKVFIFGCGEVARQVVLFLQHHAGEKIASMVICCPHSSKNFVASLKAHFNNAGITLPFALEATSDKSHLAAADFVVTVTSNSKMDSPLIAKKEELAAGAVTLSLGTNEMPTDYLDYVLLYGFVFCDDIANVSDRGAQALAIHFEKRGTTLLKEAERYPNDYRIHELADMDPFYKDDRVPVHVACSGLAALDVKVAHQLLLAIAAKQGKVIH